MDSNEPLNDQIDNEPDNDEHVNDETYNGESEQEPIILPIPVSLSQLMGSFMNTTMVYTTNINTENPVNNQGNDNQGNDNQGNDNQGNDNQGNDNEETNDDTNALPYGNIDPTNNLFMNIFTGNHIPAQGLTQHPGPQTFEEQIVNQTFNQQNKYKKVCSKDFINSLSVQKVTKEMVEKKITCGICLDELKEGEEILELPCKDKHYFHIKNTMCDGIYPWLKDNNTCPLCRHEFPSDEKEIEVSNVEPIRPILRPINLMEIVNQVIQDEEERILQETILESLNDYTTNQ